MKTGINLQPSKTKSRQVSSKENTSLESAETLSAVQPYRLTSLHLSPKNVIQLQHVVGNRAIQRMLNLPAVSSLAPGLMTVQRVTEPPAEVTVTKNSETGEIISIKQSDRELIYITNDGKLGDDYVIPEGVALVTPGSQFVRFAKVDTSMKDFALMPKIKKVNFVEGESSKSTGEKESTKDEKKPSKEEKEPVQEFAELVIEMNPEQDKRFENFMGFEIVKPKDKSKKPINKGDEHFEKHGGEFGAKSKKEYINLAKAFASEGDKDYLTAIINTNIIKVDGPEAEIRRVFISNGKYIRTFYTYDERFSDPFAYAIYYTITSAMGISLKKIDTKIISMLGEYNIDLNAMEREVIKYLLLEQKTPQNIARQTCTTVEFVKQIQKDL